MANPVSSYPASVIIDPENGTWVHITSFGHLRVASTSILLGENPGGSLDTSFWSVSTSGGAKISAKHEVLTIETTGGVNARGLVLSRKRARFFSGMENYYLAGIRLPELNVPNTTRRWGVFDELDGIFFEYTDTIHAVRRHNGAETRYYIDDETYTNDILPAMTTGFVLYTILYSGGRAIFTIGNRTVLNLAIGRETGEGIVARRDMKIGLECMCVSGGTSVVRLQQGGASVSRIGLASVVARTFTITGAGSYLVKSRAGGLKRILRTDAGGAASTIYLYDGLDSSGEFMASIDLAKDSSASFDFGTEFSEGLFITTSPIYSGSTVVIYD